MAFFNPNEVEIRDNSDFGPIPEGEYNVVAENADLEPPRDDGAQQITLRWVIDEGQPHAGRIVFDRLWFEHPKEEAQAIGHENLAKICKFANLGELDSVYDLDGARLRIKVKHTPKDNGNGVWENVHYYMPWKDETRSPQSAKATGQAAVKRAGADPKLPSGSEEPPF